MLVIEDNQDMRAYIVDSIKDRYQVITAQNGEEGLILACQAHPTTSKITIDFDDV